MAPERFEAVVNELWKRLPFRPFTIIEMNGTINIIDRLDAFTYRDGSAFFIAAGGRPAWFTHDSVSEITGN